MRVPLLVSIISVMFLVVLCLTEWIAPKPENLEREPDNWRTYRCYINHGIAAREAGHYNEALTSLLYAYANAPKPSRAWMVATINLAMVCEILGKSDESDEYYCQAGKFCTLSSSMRTGGAWRKMREKIEADNNNPPTGERP